jgi:F0F1-type ATP synthase membrane subunit b/b'
MLILQIIILMAFIFGGLLFVLHHILTKNISSATTHLDQMNADFLHREEEIKNRQAEAQKLFDDMVSKAKDEADKIRAEANHQIQQEKDKVLEDARGQSEQIIEKAEKTKELLIQELRQEIETKMVTRVHDFLKLVFPKNVQEEVHKLWVADLLSGSLNQLRDMRIPADVDTVKVTSAFPLTASDKSALGKKFKELMKREMHLKEEVDASLMGGWLITMGSLVLDGTVVNKIEQVVKENA